MSVLLQRRTASQCCRRITQRRLQSTSASEASLTWPQFLGLRRTQRRVGFVASIPTTLLGLSLGGSYFGSIEADPTDLIFGIEPIYVYGIATVSCVGLGWLVGPSLGNIFWRLANRRVLPSYDLKERQFYDHVKRMRADPSRQSVQNPAPDFYAEKVGSIKDYRQWLRDQAVFRRKAYFGGEKPV